VDARFITLAALNELFLDGKIEEKVVKKAIADLGINSEKPNPVTS
jgi:pyruvate dehydrogenase complex dehydrogenase (E1) component